MVRLFIFFKTSTIYPIYTHFNIRTNMKFNPRATVKKLAVGDEKIGEAVDPYETVDPFAIRQKELLSGLFRSFL